MKKKLAWAGMLFLVFALVSVPFGIWKVLAAAPPYEIKILEITDNPTNGKYELAEALKGTQHVSVETMRMKTFVALRDELDGKYDAIYFGSGTYSTEKPKAFPNVDVNEQAKEHDTTNKMNDITNLKVQEITDKYIGKGLPVIFNRAIATNQNSGVLRTFYNTYVSGGSSNVLYTDGPADASFQAVVTKIKNGDPLFKQRPQLKVTAKPDDFTQAGAKIYTTGDTLTFNFDAYYVRDFASPVNVQLYASVDKVLPLTDENIVASKTITQQSGSITYKLPQTYSGPIYWKLVLSANSQSDYATGAFRVHDQKTVIRVLQVMPSNDASSLLKATNMNQAYLKSDDYDIQITPILFKEFNTAGNANSYENLNGKYDMVIFGFIDNYNSQTSSNLTDATAKGVNDFINTGQAVMFTHDTMIGESSNPWIKSFQKTTGQTGLYTNLGRSAPNKSTRTTQVNSGMLTQFPFDLSLKPGNTDGFVGQIAQTHNQYYMLDLEDPTLIPWYNIVSESGDTYKRDTNDSYDHYYTYSKGNMTYSGTGHTNTNFPEWEQKLFVNTMFRAFIGSNHAPAITVLSPTANETTKQSYLSDLTFSYQVDDLDLKDLNVYSSVRFKVNGQYVDNMAIKEKTIQKGQVITETFANPLPLASGTIQIEITARDKQGAKVVKTIDLTVEKVTANLKTNRTIKNADANSEFKLGDPVGMTYTVTPQEIPAANIRAGEKGMKTLEISNIVYSETIPAGLRLVTPLPTGVKATGSPETGYTLTRDLDKVTYTLSADNSKYAPNKESITTFDLNVVPLKKGYFSLNQARLQYDDIHAPAGSASSGNANSEAVNLIKGYSLITLGGDTTTITGGSILGRTLFNGPATLSNFSIGSDALGTYDASFPTVSANGDLSITGGSINKGPIVTNGSFTSSQFGFNNTVIMAGKDVTLNGNNGLSSSSVWAGRNFNLVNYNIGNTLKFYAAENFNMSGGGNNGGQITYGGTSNTSSPYIIKSTTADVMAQFNTQKGITNAKGVSDFAAAKQQLINLSNAYASLSATGTWKYNDQMDSVLFKGTNPDLNVFTVDGTELTTLIGKRNNLKIDAPANSTVVLNVTGGNVKFWGGFNLTGGITKDRVLINYTGSGSVTLENIGFLGSILAPQSTVNFLGGNVQGTIVAGIYKTTGWTEIQYSSFAGSAPSTPSVTPTPPERPSIRFPDANFTVVSKVTSIVLANQSIWVGDTLKMIPVILPEDADNKKVTWSSSDPNIVTVSNEDGLAGTITGINAGSATITATSADGSNVTGSATVTVESPDIQITGGPNVNVDETISDLQVSSAGITRPLSNITWSLIGANDSSKAQLGNEVHGQTVSLKGLEAGTVILQVEATMTSPVTGVSRPFKTTLPINVLNPLSGATLSGPTWVEVGHSISLNSDVQPAGVHLSSVQWQTTSGSTSGSLSNTAAGSVIRSNTFTGSNTPGLATIGATFITRGDNPVTLNASKDIRVVDLQINGPQELYIGRSGTLNAEFLTYQPENWSDKPTDYSWTVTNLIKDGSGNLIVDPANGTPHATFNGSGTASVFNPTITADGSGGYVRVTLTVGGMTETKDIRIIPYLQQLQLRSPIDLYVGDTVNLQNEINIVPGTLDANTVLPLLEWSSANPLIATADNAPANKGVISGVKEGTTRITVIYPSPGDGLPPVSVSTIVNVHARTTTPTDPENPGGQPTTDGRDRY